MRLSRGHGPIVHFLEAVGRRSLNIFCVHTVEIIAIPWYLMVAKFSAQPVLGMWLQYAISLGSIWLVCELLRVRRALIIRFFPAQRRTPAVHYTSPALTCFSGCCGAAIIKVRGESGYEQRCPRDPCCGPQPRC